MTWSGRLASATVIVWVAACIPGERPLAAHLACAGDTCGCASGYDDCDGTPHNGCEADLGIDPHHCGACDLRCDNGQCVQGECVAAEGYVNCNEDWSDGFEAHLQSDPSHCGSCGHDCLGGSCSNGRCGPFLLTAPGLWTEALTTDSTHLYFAEYDTQSIMRLAQTGGDVEVLAVDQDCFGRVMVVGDALYWSAAVDQNPWPSLLIEGSISDGSTRVLHYAEQVRSVRAEGDTLAWWASADDGTWDSIIMVRSGATTTPIEVYRTEDYLGAFTLADDEMYFIEYEDDEEPRSLMRMPLLGGPAVQVAELSRFGVWTLRRTETHIHWGEWLNDDSNDIRYRIMRLARDGGEPEELYRGHNARSDLVPMHADSSGVYWAEREGQRLLHIPRDSDEVEELAAYQDVQALTTSPTAVFWVDYPGKILGLAKEEAP